MTDALPNGYQVRTNATKALLLNAAEKVFVRDGFEGAQLQAIAKAAKRTKGAIYAHYRSKEDLFLALYEDRTRSQIDRLVDRLKPCRTKKTALREFRAFILEIAKDRIWPLLTLEFKLYSVRHPESRKRLIELSGLVSSLGKDAIQHEILSGLTRVKQQKLAMKAVALTPLLSSLTLESYFEPELLSESHLEVLLDRFLDVIFEDLE